MKFINLTSTLCAENLHLYIYIYVHWLLIVKKRGEMPANALVDFSQFLTSVCQSRSGAIRKHLSAIIIFVHPDRNDGKLSETESRRRSRCSRRMLLGPKCRPLDVLENVVWRWVGRGVVRIAGVRGVRVTVGRRVRDRRRVSAVGDWGCVCRAHQQSSLVARRGLNFRFHRFGLSGLDRLRFQWFGESHGNQGEQNDGLQCTNMRSIEICRFCRLFNLLPGTFDNFDKMIVRIFEIF